MNNGLIEEPRPLAAPSVGVFTPTEDGLVPASGGGVVNFLRADGVFAAPPAGGAGNFGTAVLDFGAFPGQSHVTAAVIGQAAIVAGSIVRAWIRPVATADHSADEHMLETLDVHAADIVAGVGFTIHGFNKNPIHEREPLFFLVGVGQAQAGSPRQAGHEPSTFSEGRGTRIYGQWNVAWNWA